MPPGRARKPRVHVHATARIRIYPIIRDAMESAVAYGWRRAWKHAEDPPEGDCEAQQEAILDEVMNAICELFVFDEEPDA